MTTKKIEKNVEMANSTININFIHKSIFSGGECGKLQMLSMECRRYYLVPKSQACN